MLEIDLLDELISLILSLITVLTFLAGIFFGVAIALAKVAMVEGLLKRVWKFMPEILKDELWYLWFYMLPRLFCKPPEKILFERLDKKNIVVFLEMDYQYSEKLVRLYDKFYTNYVVIWDRFKNNDHEYNLLCNQMKSKMIKTFKKENVDRNNTHIRLSPIRLSPSQSSRRELEIIIINDHQEFGEEMQNKMKLPKQNNRCRCFIVPMLTEEVINYATRQCFDVDKIVIFTILEIPNEKQFKQAIKTTNGRIVYAPLISQEIIKNYYREKYNKER